MLIQPISGEDLLAPALPWAGRTCAQGPGPRGLATGRAQTGGSGPRPRGARPRRGRPEGPSVASLEVRLLERRPRPLPPGLDRLGGVAEELNPHQGPGLGAAEDAPGRL